MNTIITKQVFFYGAALMAVQDATTGTIHVGVSFICNGIGLSEGQKDGQVKKIKSDAVLKRGSKMLPVKFDGQAREVLCLELMYVPIWLAKIEITPAMQERQPDVAERLVKYQLEAANVLANAFIPKPKNRKKNVDAILRTHCNMAKTIITHLGVKPGIAYSLAFAEAEKESGESLESYKTLLPATEHTIGRLTPSMIGGKIGISAVAVNKKLEELGLQTRNEKNDWHLTDAGKELGEEVPFTRNGHSDYRPLWNVNVLAVLQEATT